MEFSHASISYLHLCFSYCNVSKCLQWKRHTWCEIVYTENITGIWRYVSNITSSSSWLSQLCYWSRQNIAHPARSDSDDRSRKKTSWSRSRSVAGRDTATGWRPAYVCEEWAQSGWAPWSRSPARCPHRPHWWPGSGRRNVMWGYTVKLFITA